MKTKEAEIKLDEFERGYWQRVYGAFIAAREQAAAAQQQLGEAQAALSGCALMLREKYGFDDKTALSPDGDIVSHERTT